MSPYDMMINDLITESDFFDDMYDDTLSLLSNGESDIPLEEDDDFDESEFLDTDDYMGVEY